MSDSVPKLNKKKVLHQSIFVVIVILIVLGIRFIPWLFSQPIAVDQYASYRTLYDAVTEYNYDNGRSDQLETRLEDGTSADIAENNPTRYFFNLQAKALYYQHFGYTRKAIHLLEEATYYAPDEEELDVVEYAIDLYTSYLDGDASSGI
ncbi:hypothetical protein IJG66_00925 [Candidatus Saccharibacteria bacterium]|nr:hypothetical protein [Candidatus Saccharibacteria bacterium]